MTAPRGTCGQHKVDQIVQNYTNQHKIQSYHHHDNDDIVHMGHDRWKDRSEGICMRQLTAVLDAMQVNDIPLVFSRIRWRLKRLIKNVI